MRLLCIFFHNWKLIRYWNFWDTSFGERVQSYMLTYICCRCKKIKEEPYYACPHLTDEVFDIMKKDEA